jgi:hypothetical protein
MNVNVPIRSSSTYPLTSTFVVGTAGFEPATSASRSLPTWIAVDPCGQKPQVRALWRRMRTGVDVCVRAMDARWSGLPWVRRLRGIYGSPHE